MKAFAGIGSRLTPNSMAPLMRGISSRLEKEGYTLFSGGAEGADTFFEEGISNPESKIIFLPVRGFRGHPSEHWGVCEKAKSIAKDFHPKWDSLSPFVKTLMARNSYQVLGPNLDTPVRFVVCWTPDGKASGGTGQAVRIAQAHGIPVFNLKEDVQKVALGKFLQWT